MVVLIWYTNLVKGLKGLAARPPGPNNWLGNGSCLNKILTKVRPGSQVVGILAFYSNDPSSNPAGYLNFLYEKAKIN